MYIYLYIFICIYIPIAIGITIIYDNITVICVRNVIPSDPSNTFKHLKQLLLYMNKYI